MAPYGKRPAAASVRARAARQERAEPAQQGGHDLYRLLADNASDVIWTVDMNARPTYISPSITRLLGYTVEEAMALSMQEAYSPASFILAVQIFEEELAKELTGEADPGRSRLVELDLNCKDGTTVPVEVNFKFLRDPEGRACGTLAIARNIVRRRQVEAQLREANERLEQKVQERTAELRTLAVKLASAEQRERRRIAHILHEDLQQVLVAARMSLLGTGKATDGAQAAERVAETLPLISQALQISKSLVADLRPPVLYEFGLDAALDWLAGEMANRFGLTVAVVKGDDPGRLSDDMLMFLFEAVRELLFNVVKHAGVKAARVKLDSQPDRLVRVAVEDAGTGFNPEHRHGETFGLCSIRERAVAYGGQFRVDSAQGQGTRVTLTVPAGQ